MKTDHWGYEITTRSTTAAEAISRSLAGLYQFKTNTMPNINAALLCAQMEQLDHYIDNKRKLAELYTDFFDSQDGLTFFKEAVGMKANYWLNVVICKDKKYRDEFLQATNDNGVMTRPSWELMHRLKMFESAEKGDMFNSEWLADRLVNIPSSVRLESGQIKTK